MSEVVPVLRFRGTIPTQWRKTLDTRIYWLWHQRLGTVQTISKSSDDVLDRVASELVMSAVYGDQLNPLLLLMQRLEGGALLDADFEAEILDV